MLDRDERISLQVARIKQAAIDSGMTQWRETVIAFLRKNPLHQYGTQLAYRADPNKLIRDWGPDRTQWPKEILFDETLPWYSGRYPIN